MPAPCFPIAKLVTTVITHPARHAMHHVVRRVVRHAHPRPTGMTAPRPSPAVQCLQKPGVLPAGPGASAPAQRSAATLPGAGVARLGAGAAGAGAATGGVGAASASGGAGMLASIVAAAGLAIGGVMMTSIIPSTPSPGTRPLAQAANDVQDTMRMFRLTEAIPGFASLGLPTNLTLPNQPGTPADTNAPSLEPSDVPAGPATQMLAFAMPDEVAPVSVPEPASIALLTLGSLGALLTRRWRWRSDNQDSCLFLFSPGVW